VVTRIFTCYNHVFMKVLNCGYVCQVAVILKYIYLGMYIWRVFSLLLLLCAIYLLWGWAKMNSSVGTLTTNA
jgi:hypothetical protein